MHMTFLPLRDLPAYVERAPTIPHDEDRSEVRLYATIITGSACWALLQPALYIATVEGTPLYAVARVATSGHPNFVAALFLFVALALVPHLVSLVFAPSLLPLKLPRKMAAGAMVGAGILWGILATAARPLDMGPLALYYWASAGGFMLVGGAYGYSLNAQQAQEKRTDEIASETR